MQKNDDPGSIAARRGRGAHLFVLAAVLAASPAPALADGRYVASGEAGVGYDTNANHWRDADERLESAFAFATAALSRHFDSSSATAFDVRFSAAGERWRELPGLSNTRLGAGLRLVNRTGDEFFAPTLVSSLSLAWWQFDSRIRDGADMRFSLALWQPLTTQLSVRPSFGASWRSARGAAFDIRQQRVGVQFDWNAAARLSVFGGYQILFGDVVSSGPRSPGIARVARAITPDDALGQSDFVAYRVDAHTHVLSLGANYGLSPNWALETRADYADSRADGDNRYQRWTTIGSLLARF